jgi:hypothetical protein
VKDDPADPPGPIPLDLSPPVDPSPFDAGAENAFAAAVRKLLPNGVADKCRIQVIVQMPGEAKGQAEEAEGLVASHASENAGECHSASSHS